MGDFFAGWLLGVLCGGFLLILILSSQGKGPVQVRDGVRTEAIEAGVAEYRVDPKTGETSFHWLKKE